MKNKRFKKKYTIVVEGITTNDFASDFAEKAVRAFVGALNEHYKQIDVRIQND